MPGLAANSRIFEYIKLPENDFEFHFLEWLVPDNKDESLDNYVKRLSKFIKHPNAILIGVSFGGVIVQELKKYVNPDKIILISSIKNKYEMPARMRFSQKTNMHKVIPTKALSNIEKYEKFAFTNLLKKRVKLYKKYMSMRDDLYLQWAIHCIVNWQRKETDPEVLHIHGTDDFIFPSENIKNYIAIESGTHIMILDKAKKINRILHEILIS